MADILIKNMEKPKRCEGCYLGSSIRYRDKYDEKGYCACSLIAEGDDNIEDAMKRGYRSSKCPLVEVPTHGDLIDRDELLTDLADRMCVDDMLDGIYQPSIDRINEAKTVLEAST